MLIHIFCFSLFAYAVRALKKRWVSPRDVLFSQDRHFVKKLRLVAIQEKLVSSSQQKFTSEGEPRAQTDTTFSVSGGVTVTNPLRHVLLGERWTSIVNSIIYISWGNRTSIKRTSDCLRRNVVFLLETWIRLSHATTSAPVSKRKWPDCCGLLCISVAWPRTKFDIDFLQGKNRNQTRTVLFAAS